MALARVYSRAQNGLDADLVTVEVHLAAGLPGLSIVGLPEMAVREAKDRVKAAINTCGYEFPNRRITCNLAPADLPKEGGRFDLAIALGILAASNQIPAKSIENMEIFGELSLSGEIRAVPGILPAALKAAATGRPLLVPKDSGAEAALANQAQVFVAHHLGALCGALHASKLEPFVSSTASAPTKPSADLNEVRGQQLAKRALEIAAAGSHSLLVLCPIKFKTGERRRDYPRQGPAFATSRTLSESGGGSEDPDTSFTRGFGESLGLFHVGLSSCP